MYLGKRQTLNICYIIFIELACGDITEIAAKSISLHAKLLPHQLTMAGGQFRLQITLVDKVGTDETILIDASKAHLFGD